MSVTTTDNPITTTINREIQQDYEIRLTGYNETVAPPNADNRPPPATNPSDWPTEHRGVPPYRPINTELDRSQRPWGGSLAIDVFLVTMLHGVCLNATYRRKDQ
ncbi:hypothetical protein VP1G_04062 [Cytospora mali]|uniref:Uncharacterized protein n=1 Tax=Cytospora mali TaxID=578113 RepID=A0A194UYD7_CYTMA|nr:hypothetical protein VP1G_04062 [Valsa mali var. pyri (nom. inval.)]